MLNIGACFRIDSCLLYTSGGIIAILAELAKGGLIDTSVLRVDGMSLAEAIDQYSITSPNVTEKAMSKYSRCV